MTRRSILTLAAFVALALATAACGGSTSTPTTPSPAAPTTTETFTGTVLQNGGNINTFTVAQAGQVTATLTSVAPLSTLALGFILGSYDGTNCNPGYEDDNARQGDVLSGTTSATGTFCVRVFDVGNIAANSTVTYTVTVAHP
jgi:hypothetical protein